MAGVRLTPPTSLLKSDQIVCLVPGNVERYETFVKTISGFFEFFRLTKFSGTFSNFLKKILPRTGRFCGGCTTHVSKK